MLTLIAAALLAFQPAPGPAPGACYTSDGVTCAPQPTTLRPEDADALQDVEQFRRHIVQLAQRKDCAYARLVAVRLKDSQTVQVVDSLCGGPPKPKVREMVQLWQ